MKPLHMREKFINIYGKDLAEKQSNTILESHIFIKEKRDGTLKGRTVAGVNN